MLLLIFLMVILCTSYIIFKIQLNDPLALNISLYFKSDKATDTLTAQLWESWKSSATLKLDGVEMINVSAYWNQFGEGWAKTLDKSESKGCIIYNLVSFGEITFSRSDPYVRIFIKNIKSIGLPEVVAI